MQLHVGRYLPRIDVLQSIQPVQMQLTQLEQILEGNRRQLHERVAAQRQRGQVVQLRQLHRRDGLYVVDERNRTTSVKSDGRGHDESENCNPFGRDSRSSGGILNWK